MGGACCVFRGLAGRWKRVKIHFPLGFLLLSHCWVLARMPGVSTEGRGPDQAPLFTQVATLPPGLVLSLSVQFSRSVSDSLRSHGLKHPGFPVRHQLPEPAQTVHRVGWHPTIQPSNHLILCHPLLLLPSIFPSIRVFSNESVAHIKWPKYWSFQLHRQSFQ